MRAEVAENGLTYLGNVGTPYFGRRHCSLGSRIYLLTLHEGRAIHELRADGSVLRSFHQVPEVMDPSISEMWQPDLREGASFGHLECMAEAQTLAFLPEGLPTVYAFGTDGAIQWQVNLPGYQRLRPTEVQGR